MPCTQSQSDSNSHDFGLKDLLEPLLPLSVHFQFPNLNASLWSHAPAPAPKPLEYMDHMGRTVSEREEGW